jgi:hypothetical protein
LQEEKMLVKEEAQGIATGSNASSNMSDVRARRDIEKANDESQNEVEKIFLKKHIPQHILLKMEGI